MRELYLYRLFLGNINRIGLYTRKLYIVLKLQRITLVSALYGFYCEVFVTTCYKYLRLLYCRSFCLCISLKDIYATFYLEIVTILIFILFRVSRMCGCFMSINSGLTWLSFCASQTIRYILTYRMFLKSLLFSL